MTGCLDRCEYADVVVVRPSREGRRRGGRPVWLGLSDADVLDRLRDWVGDGGPGMVDMPVELSLHEISAPRPAV